MTKNNEELKHKQKEFKMTKKNYIIIIVPILLVIIMTIIIALYVFIYRTDEYKLKKYLNNNGYICNNESCSKNVNEDTETIAYKTGILTITSIDYTYMIKPNNITYQNNNKELVCTYQGSKYEFYSNIDKTFTTNTNCEVYIEQINKTIDKYKEIFTLADIDVNQLKK